MKVNRVQFIDKKTKLLVDVSPKLAQAYHILRQHNKYLTIVSDDYVLPEQTAFDMLACLGYEYIDKNWKSSS